MDEILKLLVTECKKFNTIEKISLFGSRARGDFSDKSDYDVAVYGNIPLSDKLSIREICDEKLPTLHKIDVIFINDQKDKTFIDRINREEVIIYDKFENKYVNFGKAVKWLNEANVAYKSNSGNDIYQDALIKRFEFTFELAWKTLREFLTEQGYNLEILSPKGVLKFAYTEGILIGETVWLEMLEARNATAHDYGRELSAEVAENISVKFCKQLNELYKYLTENG